MTLDEFYRSTQLPSTARAGSASGAAESVCAWSYQHFGDRDKCLRWIVAETSVFSQSDVSQADLCDHARPFPGSVSCPHSVYSKFYPARRSSIHQIRYVEGAVPLSRPAGPLRAKRTEQFHT